MKLIVRLTWCFLYIFPHHGWKKNLVSGFAGAVLKSWRESTCWETISSARFRKGIFWNNFLLCYPAKHRMFNHNLVTISSLTRKYYYTTQVQEVGLAVGWHSARLPRPNCAGWPPCGQPEATARRSKAGYGISCFSARRIGGIQKFFKHVCYLPHVRADLNYFPLYNI